MHQGSNKPHDTSARVLHSSSKRTAHAAAKPQTIHRPPVRPTTCHHPPANKHNTTQHRAEKHRHVSEHLRSPALSPLINHHILYRAREKELVTTTTTPEHHHYLYEKLNTQTHGKLPHGCLVTYSAHDRLPPGRFSFFPCPRRARRRTPALPLHLPGAKPTHMPKSSADQPFPSGRRAHPLYQKKVRVGSSFFALLLFERCERCETLSLLFV